MKKLRIALFVYLAFDMLIGGFCAGFLPLTVGVAQVQGQAINTTPINFSESYGQGVYNSKTYNYQTSVFGGGSTAGGTYSITVFKAGITLPDGRLVSVFTTSNPITIGQGANQETVTPSSVANCTQLNVGMGAGQGGSACTITATFSNGHGPGDMIRSGSGGIQEAITDAQNNGGGMVYWEDDSGTLTLNTGGANTTFGVNMPTRSVIMGAGLRVLTTIGTCAGGWSLGWSTGTEITAANTTLTAGTTTDSSTFATPVIFNASATQPVVHCTTSNASAGVVHARVWGYKYAAPAF